MVTFESLDDRRDRIAVVGLGYVGLPLAIHLARHFDVVGYDLKQARVDELRAGRDRTLEVDDATLQASTLQFTSDPQDLADCRLIIVAVPTPIDDHRIPDLTPLRGAASTVGAISAKIPRSTAPFPVPIFRFSLLSLIWGQSVQMMIGTGLIVCAVFNSPVISSTISSQFP